MKVLLINNCHWRRGGSETVYFGTAELLQKAGHEVVFLGLEDEKNIHTNQPEYFVKRGNALKNMVAYFANGEAARVIEAVVKKEKPDIAHAHLMWGGMTAAIIPVLHKYGVPLVHTAHDYRMVCPAYTFRNGCGEICESCKGGHYISCIKNRCGKGSLVQSILMAAEMVYRNKKWHPARTIDGIIYVSQFAKNKHEEMDSRFSKVKNMVLYNCTQQHKDKEKERGDYFLYYGRLSYEKGVEQAIDAFKKLPLQKLKVVGTGPLEESLKQKAMDCKNIEFLGFKTGTELHDLVRNAQFVIVPSQWYENNPMTIVEAYSFGTPVIGSNMGGIPEIIKEGATGFVYQHDKIESLIYAINSAVKISNDAYFQMTKMAQNFYDKNFSDKEYANKLLKFYGEVIEDFKNGK